MRLKLLAAAALLTLIGCGIELNDSECVTDDDCAQIAQNTVCSTENWCVSPASAAPSEKDMSTPPPAEDASPMTNPVVDMGVPVVDMAAVEADMAPVEADMALVEVDMAVDGATD